jgi:hypothetical protein
MAIYGNTVGGFSPIKVMQLELEDGTVLEGVVAEEAPVIDATENDVRKGKTVITSAGVIEGQKEIPAYETRMSSLLVMPNSACSIPLKDKDRYDYTQFQCIIVVFNPDYSNSVTTKYISVNDGLFSSEKSEKVSNIIKNNETKSINLNITNNSEDIYEIIYFTYKEI